MQTVVWYESYLVECWWLMSYQLLQHKGAIKYRRLIVSREIKLYDRYKVTFTSWKKPLNGEVVSRVFKVVCSIWLWVFRSLHLSCSCGCSESHGPSRVSVRTVKVIFLLRCNVFDVWLWSFNNIEILLFYDCSLLLAAKSYETERVSKTDKHTALTSLQPLRSLRSNMKCCFVFAHGHVSNQLWRAQTLYWWKAKEKKDDPLHHITTGELHHKYHYCMWTAYHCGHDTFTAFPFLLCHTSARHSHWKSFISFKGYEMGYVACHYCTFPHF